MTSLTISSTCPDAELSAAVAEHCAGWTRHTSNLGNAAEPFWTLGKEYQHSWQFAFAESVDACLPLIEESPNKEGDGEWAFYRCLLTPGAISFVGQKLAWNVFLGGDEDKYSNGTKNVSLARAICLSLLKSKGFEVTP